VLRSLPDGYRPYYRGGTRYYFSGGIWYAPRGPEFVVVSPPPGLVVTVLPPYYSTVWIGGAPYYYADDVYYTWQPDQNGYAVVDPPDNADAPSPPPPPPTDSAQSDLMIYPKNGQTKEQQSADQFECHDWRRVRPASIRPSRAEESRAMPTPLAVTTTARCPRACRAGATSQLAGAARRRGLVADRRRERNPTRRAACRRLWFNPCSGMLLHSAVISC